MQPNALFVNLYWRIRRRLVGVHGAVRGDRRQRGLVRARAVVAPGSGGRSITRMGGVFAILLGVLAVTGVILLDVSALGSVARSLGRMLLFVLAGV